MIEAPQDTNGIHAREYDLSDAAAGAAKTLIDGVEAEEPINVYLVAHSHLDPGWMVTIDEYYVGQVRFILNHVIDELWKTTPSNNWSSGDADMGNPRKFTWCETIYLEKYWEDREVK